MGLDIAGALGKPLRLAELRGVLEALKPVGSPLSAADIATAIAGGRMFLEYQPKLALPSRELAGAEALVRWRSPEGKLTMPGDFLPLIEETAVIEDLTWFVVGAALAQLRLWNALGLACPISVNVSSCNLLYQLDFDDRLTAMYEARLQLAPPGQLVLELTETAAIQDQVSSIDVLTRLRLKGFDLSLDDVGTGYSSIAQLYRLPFVELKIDRGFVDELGASAEAEVIVKAIIDLAHNLGLRACAEGVPNEAGLAMLERLGCDLVQGFHIARRMSGHVIPGWRLRGEDGAPETVVRYPGELRQRSAS